ncbi:WbuC family cupin fold metalloprotein [Hydrogenovibrio marinus]|uniref:Cupin fold metalloprotein WbuC cupin domain-containing protein n=1 Tax=Hydrogenovibrio marinus TaxID=28885 RepID=A0A066ZWX2_HYDMR|nr:WbuC family cupin fold metalloprotein [Hydrogenovibrio marinus]KDN96759.1 hypothetical protein EI16_10980 [Hydrogenovibrio marinus]BBN59009.1 hypothetical protein HVMH_0603 [Hydrogenovibrio marinus]
MERYRTFGQNDWQTLQERAEASNRKRAHFNLHTSFDESIQKTLICLLYGTYIPPHYHRHKYQKELFVVLKGRVKVLFFDHVAKVTEVLYLGGEGQSCMVEISHNSIHTVVCLSELAHVMEIKEGPFLKDDCKEFLQWTISEQDQRAGDYVRWLEIASENQVYG